MFTNFLHVITAGGEIKGCQISKDPTSLLISTKKKLNTFREFHHYLVYSIKDLETEISSHLSWERILYCNNDLWFPRQCLTNFHCASGDSFIQLVTCVNEKWIFHSSRMATWIWIANGIYDSEWEETEVKQVERERTSLFI